MTSYEFFFFDLSCLSENFFLASVRLFAAIDRTHQLRPFLWAFFAGSYAAFFLFICFRTRIRNPGRVFVEVFSSNSVLVYIYKKKNYIYIYTFWPWFFTRVQLYQSTGGSRCFAHEEFLMIYGDHPLRKITFLVRIARVWVTLEIYRETFTLILADNRSANAKTTNKLSGLDNCRIERITSGRGDG